MRCALLLVVALAHALRPLRPPFAARARRTTRFGKTRGDGSGDASGENPLDVEVIDDALGTDGWSKETEDMRVGELTAELDLRGVDYSDCVEADELRARLKDARLSGTASKDVIDQFNKATAEAMFDPSKNPTKLTEDEIEQIKGADGAIPGGLQPDEVFKLMNDPEIMAMLQRPKFQEIMSDVMGGGGPSALNKHMHDKESREMMMTLTRLLQGAGMVPPNV
mmetsp:Transcript_33278/g.102228  ORF Transcript_33278/g.102228 Transcript_33278/m.102228 type:complete len:223 (-) Transcript_33278:11-679(-)